MLRYFTLSAALRQGLWLCLSAAVLGCKSPEPLAKQQPTEGPSKPAGTTAEAVPSNVEVELLSRLEHCELRDDGMVLDLGADGTDWRRGFRLGPFADVRGVERGGETFGQFRGDQAGYSFWLTEAQAELQVEVRGYGAGARHLAIDVDRKRLGLLRMESGVARVFSLPIPSGLKAGLHTLGVRFVGAPRGNDEPYGEIDWIRIRARGGTTEYPPTFRDVVSEVALGSVPHRVLAFKSSVNVRCPVSLSGQAKLAFSLGFWGKGKGEAQVRLLLDGEAPRELLRRQVTGGDAAAFAPVALALGSRSSGVGLLEIGATSAEGGRVVFGDPRVREEARPKTPRTNLAVVVVASSLNRQDVPPWGTGEPAAALGEFARTAVAFPNYRVQSTLASSVMASLLSGLPAGVHGLNEASPLLLPDIQTLQRALKASGGHAAFLSAVPTTFGAFGFARDWDEYFNASPVLDLPATEVISRAAAWLESQSEQVRTRPHLLVVHTRGTHPPWDLTRVEAQRLGPKEYAGNVDARRGGILIGDVRRRGKKLKDDDWARLRELQSAAYSKELLSTKRLFSSLKKHDLLDSALIVYMGDVASPRPPTLPFDPAGDLSEARLNVPLLVKFPGGAHAGTENTAVVTTDDISATIAEALGLPALPHVQGLDLFSMVKGYSPPEGRALLAVRGQTYVTRSGVWQLSGTLGRVPRLCRTDSDPACSEDVFSSASYAARAIWLQTFEELSRQKELASLLLRPAGAPRLVLDPDTRAALTVWGDIP